MSEPLAMEPSVEDMNVQLALLFDIDRDDKIERAWSMPEERHDGVRTGFPAAPGRDSLVAR